MRKCLKQKEEKSSLFGVCVYKHRHMCAIVCIWRSEDSFRCWSLLLLCLNQVSVGFGVCFFLHLPGVLAHALQGFSCFHLLFFCISTGMTHTCPAASNLFKFVLAIDTQSSCTLPSESSFQAKKAISLENFGIFFEVN